MIFPNEEPMKSSTSAGFNQPGLSVALLSPSTPAFFKTMRDKFWGDQSITNAI
jgi:hypothetical protein